MSESARARRVEWENILGRWEASGASATDFCRDASIPMWKFYYWKKRLRPKIGTQAAGDGFVEISFGERRRDIGLRVELPTGARLVLESGFDADELIRVLRAVESARC